jgi:hypothetical protein
MVKDCIKNVLYVMEMAFFRKSTSNEIEALSSLDLEASYNFETLSNLDLEILAKN